MSHRHTENMEQPNTLPIDLEAPAPVGLHAVVMPCQICNQTPTIKHHRAGQCFCVDGSVTMVCGCPTHHMSYLNYSVKEATRLWNKNPKSGYDDSNKSYLDALRKRMDQISPVFRAVESATSAGRCTPLPSKIRYLIEELQKCEVDALEMVTRNRETGLQSPATPIQMRQ